jgi:hypothetical protein
VRAAAAAAAGRAVAVAVAVARQAGVASLLPLNPHNHGSYSL